MLPFVFISNFLFGSLHLTPLCEEAENQFHWLVQNDTQKAVEFKLKAVDKAGYSFRGRIAPNDSLHVITYRKLKEAKGADVWRLESGKFSQTATRSRESCRQVEEPPVCPPPPPTIPPPPPPLKHPCLPADDPMQAIDHFSAYVRIRTDLSDSTKTYTFFEDIGFTLQTCETMSIAGRFSQTNLRNTFNLSSQMVLVSPQDPNVTRMALLASDGTVVSESACDASSCILAPFVIKDLQGNFGLSSGSTYYIVVDSLDDAGTPVQKMIVFTTN